MKSDVKRIFKIVGGVGLTLLLVLVWRMYVRFLPFIPHERIVITLPFAEEDDELIFINPMGETDNHPKPSNPHGHPGLDFGWDYPAPLRAAAAGKVTEITVHPSGGFGETETVYDVEIVSGIYAIRYTEIAPDKNMKVGARVDQGDVIGRGGEYDQPGGLGIYYSTHWEFDYDTPVFDRLCPLTYFDEASRARIQNIWEKVGDTHQGRFTEICSGDYKNRHE